MNSKTPIQEKLKKQITEAISLIPTEYQVLSVVKEHYGDEDSGVGADLFGILCEKNGSKYVFLLAGDYSPTLSAPVLFDENSFKERYAVKDYPELVRHSPHSFLAQTLRSLGLTEEDNKKYAFFDTDQHDNLIILYSDIEGKLYNATNEEDTLDKGWKRHYHVLRYKYPKQELNYEKGEHEEQKYFRVRMLPYFTPTVLEAYKEKKTVETLYFIEGEKKAVALWKQGKAVIGLGSIQGFYDQIIKGKINGEILEAIKSLNPTKIVLINDADTLSLKWKEDKDLSKRISNFASAVINFREGLDTLISDGSVRLQYVYYSHIRTEFMHRNAKGMDDLLAKYPDKQKDIIEDLDRLDYAKEYFSGLNLTNLNIKNINKYFGLDSVENFYDIYEEFILNNKFIYKKIQYQWDDNNKELKKVKHKDAEIFVRIGDKYAKIIQVLLAGGVTATDVVKFGVSEIKRDYGDWFIKQIPKVDGVTIEPDNSASFKEFIEIEKEGRLYRYYNMYKPCRIEPRQGSIANTLFYLSHLFGGKAKITQGEGFEIKEENVTGDALSIAIDWLTILYKHPKQFLPVILLLSKGQETGKTTMIDWLTAIYETNAVSLKMEEFLGNFNKHWGFKLIRCIDEGSLDLEKNQAKNAFKNITTAKNIFVEIKGIDKQTIPNYGKMIICTNDEDKVMRLEDDDSRFFPIKVPKLPKKDPEFLRKLTDEIPAFLHWIGNRDIFHPKESRLWFRVDYLKTEQFRKIVAATKPAYELEIDEFVKDKLLTYRLQEVRMTLNYMLESINKIAKFKISIHQIQEYLKKRGYQTNKNGQLVSDGNGRMRIPYGFETIGDKVEPKFLSEQGRYFTFKYKDWLEESEQEEVEKGLEALDMTEFNPSAIKQITAEEIRQYVFAYITSLEVKGYKVSDLVRHFNAYHKTNIDPIEFTDYAQAYIQYAESVNYQNGTALHRVEVSLATDRIEIKEVF